MQPKAWSLPPRRLIPLALVALVAVVAIPASSAIARTAATKRVAKLQELADGGSVLANLRGRTLYSLSAEKHGRFICVAGCLSAWHPLVVPRRVKPAGPVKLGRVKRPDGRIQVTFRGRPLYVFSGDAKQGETNGEGLRDVGTWHPAKRKGSSAPQPSQPEPYPTTPAVPTAPAPAPAESPPQSPPSESESPPSSEPPYQPPYGY
jgi:predicted lipoprotein with Yx(FWY)xxD motif